VRLGDCAILTRSTEVRRLKTSGTRNFRYTFETGHNRIYAIRTFRDKIRATAGALRYIWL
jgi:hypothetical protein